MGDLINCIIPIAKIIKIIEKAACEYIGMELEWEGSGDSEVAKEKKTGIVRISHFLFFITVLLLFVIIDIVIIVIIIVVIVKIVLSTN